MAQLLSIRRATTIADICAAILEGNKLQWNISLLEADVFVRANMPFFVGESNGEPVAWISAATYPTSSVSGHISTRKYCHISMFLVKEGMRKSGYGSQMWRHLLSETEGCDYGLDAVEGLVQQYEQKGFKIAATLPLFSFKAAAALQLSSERFPQGATPVTAPTMALVKWLPTAEDRVLSDRIASYDGSVTGVRRDEVLAAYASMPRAVARAAVLNDGSVVGVIIGIQEQHGDTCEVYLLADSPAIARSLLVDVCAAAPTSHCYIWPPSTNSAALELVTSLGAELAFSGLVRMHNNHSIDAGTALRDVHRIYGVLSPEFG